MTLRVGVVLKEKLLRFVFCVFAAIARTVDHLSKSAKVIKLVNNLMKAPEIAITMKEFNKEMTKEMVSDLVDNALDLEDIEVETEEEIEKILSELASETAA
ncbi:Snf7 family [Dillenia turbinata]|uniref:Snf7 family n=1 Tax=Dillenia turbinata TaxID=194707 RepID=A0AAN8VLH6_9MAGN